MTTSARGKLDTAHSPSDTRLLHTFGELTYVRLLDSHCRNKLQPRAVLGVIVGYEDALGTKGYRIWVPSMRKLFVTHNVRFMG